MRKTSQQGREQPKLYGCLYQLTFLPPRPAFNRTGTGRCQTEAKKPREVGPWSSRSPSLMRQEKALSADQRHHGMGFSQSAWLCHFQTRTVPGQSLQHERRPSCKTFSHKREGCLYPSFSEHCPRTQLSMGHTLGALGGSDRPGWSPTSHHSV